MKSLFNPLRNALVATVCLCIVSVSALADGVAPTCHYLNLATFPVQVKQNQVIVQGSVNGKATPMQIDTGAFYSTMSDKGVEDLGLSLIHSGLTSVGIGGEARTYQTVVDDLAIDKYRTAPHKRFLVAMQSFMPYPVIIGADILFNADIELNLADHQIRLFQPKGCDDTFLAYWNSDASDVSLLEMNSHDSRQVVEVEINGHPIRAMVDSGAQYSVINLAFAASIGINPDSPGVSSADKMGGLGTHQVQSWIVQFDSFAIGNETIKNPRIRMMDMWGSALSDSNTRATSDLVRDQPAMLLGADFLKTHRALLALSQRRLYFSYLGGNVFEKAAAASAKPPGNQVPDKN